MTCQDNCLYYPLCRDSGFLLYHTRIKKTLTLTENVENECPFKKFKNKADFVEVVRCCDCKYCKFIIDRDGNGVVYCDRTFAKSDVDPTDFCSYGERK